MSFERKKIQSETLSEYLAAIRQAAGLDTETVARKTGIKKQFVLDLEAGKFGSLPADVYVCGFLKQLANLYAVDGAGLIEQYKKEKGIQTQIQPQNKSLDEILPKGWLKKLVITPKLVSLLLGIGFIILTVGYIIWQVWSINKSPSLQIFEPADNSVITSSYVQIRGKTDPGINVTINDQNIFVDSSGGFSTQLGVSSGPQSISIVAKNSFGTQVSKMLSLTAVPPSASSTTQ